MGCHSSPQGKFPLGIIGITEKRDILKNTANTTLAFVSPHEIIKSGKAPVPCSPACDQLTPQTKIPFLPEKVRIGLFFVDGCTGTFVYRDNPDTMALISGHYPGLQRSMVYHVYAQ